MGRQGHTMTLISVALAAVGLLSVCDGRLIFPVGSDMGYIVPDEPKDGSYLDSSNRLNDVEELLSEPLRGERAAGSSVGESLLRSFLGTVMGEEPKGGAGASWEGQNYEVEPRWNERELVHQQQQEQGPKTRYGSPEDLPESLKDKKHGVAMGIPHVKCDNAKINLTMDWDYSPVNYTCFGAKLHRIPVRKDLKSVERCQEVAKDYTPEHVCMNQKIAYNTTLPTFGPHRPLWPVFGEYKFVPVQRWLHSLEHGGIVMLYDPCTEPLLVSQLRKILIGCFRKHVITPYTLLTKERPLALLAWGCSLEMSYVNEEEVTTFIKTRALHGPEGHYPKNGSFKDGLVRKAEYPQGYKNDSIICPQYNAK